MREEYKIPRLDHTWTAVHFSACLGGGLRLFASPRIGLPRYFKPMSVFQIQIQGAPILSQIDDLPLITDNQKTNPITLFLLSHCPLLAILGRDASVPLYRIEPFSQLCSINLHSFVC